MAPSDTLQRPLFESVVLRDLRGARRAVGLIWTTARLIVEGRRAPLEAAALAQRAHRTARELLDLHAVDVRCYGPPPRTPAVVVTNHVSYLDPLVIAALTPCIAIAKGEVRDWPLLGSGLRALGVVFVQRGDVRSGAMALLRAWRALDGGTTVLNFPEGTTSDGRDVAPFRRGIFGLARLAGFPVVPAHVSYDHDGAPWYGGQTLAPHYWRLSRSPSVRASVRFGAPISVLASDDPSAVAARTREVVAALGARRED